MYATGRTRLVPGELICLPQTQRTEVAVDTAGISRVGDSDWSRLRATWQKHLRDAFPDQENRNLGPAGWLLWRKLLEEALLARRLVGFCERAGQGSYLRV